MLGFQNTASSKAIIGPSSGTFAIITNNIYKSNKYINSIQNYNINIDKFIDYSKCAGFLPPIQGRNLCVSNYEFGLIIIRNIMLIFVFQLVAIKMEHIVFI
jgi:hypothetical protein